MELVLGLGDPPAKCPSWAVASGGPCGPSLEVVQTPGLRGWQRQSRWGGGQGGRLTAAGGTSTHTFYAIYKLIFLTTQEVDGQILLVKDESRTNVDIR